jgi:uncharacterized membrane protein
MKIGTTRVETFSDGVLAIIITIMVLELLPEASEHKTNEATVSYLRKILPYLVAYVLSFTMIGIFWINHHHMFHLLEKTDEYLLVQNLIFLFCISFIPIVTSLIGANPYASYSVALYGLVMLLTTFSLGVMRSYSNKKGLRHKDEDENLNTKLHKVAKRGKIKSFIGATAYLISIPLAFVNVYIAFACFIIPPIIFFIPDGVDDEKLAEKIEEKN